MSPAGQSAHERQAGCVLGPDHVSTAIFPTSPGYWQQQPLEHITPCSLVNSMCLWVQKCLNNMLWKSQMPQSEVGI